MGTMWLVHHRDGSYTRLCIRLHPTATASCSLWILSCLSIRRHCYRTSHCRAPCQVGRLYHYAFLFCPFSPCILHHFRASCCSRILDQETSRTSSGQTFGRIRSSQPRRPYSHLTRRRKRSTWSLRLRQKSQHPRTTQDPLAHRSRHIKQAPSKPHSALHCRHHLPRLSPRHHPPLPQLPRAHSACESPA